MAERPSLATNVTHVTPALPPRVATPRTLFNAPTPRLSAKDVVAAARTSVGGGTTVGARKGRPPPAPAATTLSAESRAMLAKSNSDAPPRADGYGGKVSTDGSKLVDLFDGPEVPPRLQLTKEELEQREIAKVVNQGEEASLACLSGILKDTEASMSKCEAQMALAEEKAKVLKAEMDERGPESHRPGIRAGRRRRKKRSVGRGDAAPSEADDDLESGATGSDDEEEGEEEEEGAEQEESDDEAPTALDLRGRAAR